MATAAAKKFEQEIIEWAKSKNDDDMPFEVALVIALQEITFVSNDKSFDIPSGTVTLVAQEGGDDQGEYYDVTFKVGEKYFECNGFYSSWDGVSWEGTEAIEVRPVQVTVTEYHTVDED